MNKINSLYAVEMENITKTFLNGKIVANDNIQLKVKHNEIHAIIGENGAGKSTLMSILFGIYTPDYGTIKINGEHVSFNTAKDATKVGLGMVHQHFKLIDAYSVLDNIILGSEKTKLLGFINKKKLYDELQEINQKYNFNLDLNAKISSLTVGQQQKVEILKLLYRKAQILIFDEPTAVLSENDIESFLQMILDFKKAGKTVILITHKFNEIKKVADRATVIRLGKYIDDFAISDKSIKEMADLMVGQKIIDIKNESYENFDNKPSVLSVRNLNLYKIWKNKNSSNIKLKNIKDYFYSSKKDNNKILIKKNNDCKFEINGSNTNNLINFDVHEGEIFAIAGVEGNGQSELIEYISGMIKDKDAKIYLNKLDISNMSIHQRYKYGLSYVPEDRHKHGLDLSSSVAFNSMFNQIDDPKFNIHGFLNKYEISEHAKDIINKYDVRGTSRGTSVVSSLSGGNQQKLIIGREMEKKHELLLLAQPTRGLDIGAISLVHKKILEDKQKGKAILLVSYELDEILGIADTIGIMHNGELVYIGSKNNTNRSIIGQYMSGKEKTNNE